MMAMSTVSAIVRSLIGQPTVRRLTVHIMHQLLEAECEESGWVAEWGERILPHLLRHVHSRDTTRLTAEEGEIEAADVIDRCMAAVQIAKLNKLQTKLSAAGYYACPLYHQRVQVRSQIPEEQTVGHE